MDNGVRLGWLIDRKHRNVEIYRLTEHQLGKPAEILIRPTALSGEEILPEFKLDLAVVW